MLKLKELSSFCPSVCVYTPVHALRSNSVLLSSASLRLDPAHMGRAEKGELRVAGQELSFIRHRHHHRHRH